MQRDQALGRLAIGQPGIGILDAVRHRVAQQVLQRTHHAFENRPIHVLAAADYLEPGLLSNTVTGLTHHALESRHAT